MKTKEQKQYEAQVRQIRFDLDLLRNRRVSHRLKNQSERQLEEKLFELLSLDPVIRPKLPTEFSLPSGVKCQHIPMWNGKMMPHIPDRKDGGDSWNNLTDKEHGWYCDLFNEWTRAT